MIKQKITYHKNNVVYQYIETYNNSISHIAEYDENGCIVYEEFPFFNEWTTWKRDENGYVIEFQDETGYWLERKLNSEGKVLYECDRDSGVIIDLEHSLFPIGTHPSHDIKSIPSYKSTYNKIM